MSKNAFELSSVQRYELFFNYARFFQKIFEKKIINWFKSIFGRNFLFYVILSYLQILCQKSKNKIKILWKKLKLNFWCNFQKLKILNKIPTISPPRRCPLSRNTSMMARFIIMGWGQPTIIPYNIGAGWTFIIAI